ncbi:RNA polymerase sigma factor [Pseudoflavonifractor capillosus]|uniref:RNA polymerase sigma factor n=1 Tax=Pseudoflavonifractor capillosus TaxID=106588 RepID=UPI00195EB8D4|nr:sigma-70 family RNA polymerase sigma factor [Pseudoflavonifractor capillosus]MBM6680763.1 sigma-70 family RNA polymerase sigma factor [Pseudoflavonifractor capillosus]
MTQTEQELVSRARAGDTAAFEQLMLDSQDRVYTLCLRMTGDREDALDLAQETFFNAWRGLGSFQGNSSFSTWVYRLASNACIDFLRKRKRRQQGESPHSLDDEEAPLPEPADPRGSPEEELERRELRRAVERGLQALPDHHRQVLVMRELSGMSYQEIGAVLDLDLGTVKSRIARARLALKKFLVQEGNFSLETPSKQTKSRRGG